MSSDLLMMVGTGCYVSLGVFQVVTLSVLSLCFIHLIFGGLFLIRGRGLQRCFLLSDFLGTCYGPNVSVPN